MKRRTKMWLWILLGAPVALVLLAYCVGHFLPARYTARETFEVALSPAEVWQRLHDPERFPMTGSMCKGVELLPNENGLAVWNESMGHTTLRIRDVVAEEPRHIVRELADTVVPFRGRCEFWIEAAPDGGGSTVTCENEVRIESGTWHVPFFRVNLTLFGGAKAGMKMYLGKVTKVAG